MKEPVLTCAKKKGRASKKQKDLTVDGNHDNKAKLLCDLCGNGYKTQVSLNRHKETHSKMLHYKCEHCRQGFKSSQCLRYHQGDAKKLSSDGLVDKNKLSCPKCHESFVCKGLLKDHRKCHTPRQSSKKSTSKNSGKRGLKKVNGHDEDGRTDSTAKLRTQQKDGGSDVTQLKTQQKDGGTDATQLRTQQKDGGSDATKVRTQQEDGGSGSTKLISQQKDGVTDTIKLRTQQNGCKASLLCEVCGKGLSSVKRLQWHRKTHQETTIKTKQHKCDPCNKVFRTPSCLKQHNISHHGAKSSFQCKTCKRHFLNNSRLAEHVRVVHTGEKIFHCPRCKKGFTCSRYLKRHVLEPSCTPQEKYKCDECNKLCKSKYSLMYHVNTYHGNRPFRCKYCDRRYATEEYWQKHEAAHNGVYGAIPKRKVKKATLDYMCEQCGNAYGNKHLLARHQLLHTGEKPHICTTCSKSFRCKSTLTEHVRIHSGEKPFYCEYCQTRFRLSGHLRYHLKAVHKVKKVGPIKKIKPGEEVPNRDGVEGTQDGKGGSDKTTAKVFFSPLASLKSIKASVRRRDEYRPVTETGMRCNKVDNVQPLMPPGDVGVQPDGRADELLNMLIQGSWLHGNSEGQDERTREDAFRDQYHQTQLYTSQYLPPMQNVTFDGRFGDRPYIYPDPGVDRSNPFGNVSFSQQFPGHSLQQMLFEPQQGKMNLYSCGSQKKAGYDSQSLQPIAYNAPLQGQGLNFGMTSQRHEQNLFPAGLMSDLPVTSGEKGQQDHQDHYEAGQRQDQVGFPSGLISQLASTSGDKSFEHQHYHEGQIGFNMIQQHNLASFSSRLASSQDKHIDCHDQNVIYDEIQKHGQTVLASTSVLCPDVNEQVEGRNFETDKHHTSYHPSCEASELPSRFDQKNHLGPVVSYETQKGQEQVQQVPGTGYEMNKHQTSNHPSVETSELPSTFNSKTHLGSVVGYGIQKGLDRTSFFNALTSELPLTSGNKDDNSYVPQYKELHTRASTLNQPNEKVSYEETAGSVLQNQTIGRNICKANLSTVEDDVYRSNVKVHEDNFRSNTTQDSIDSTETLPNEESIQKSSLYDGDHVPNSIEVFSTHHSSLHDNTVSVPNISSNSLASDNSSEYQNVQKEAASEFTSTPEAGMLQSTCNVPYSAPCTNRKISDLIQYLQDSNEFDQKSDKTISEGMISVQEASKSTANTCSNTLQGAYSTTELCKTSCDAISVHGASKNTANANSTTKLCKTSCDAISVHGAPKSTAKHTTLEEPKLTTLEEAKLTSLKEAKRTTLEEAKLTTFEEAKLTTLEEAKLMTLEQANSTTDELCNTSSNAICKLNDKHVVDSETLEQHEQSKQLKEINAKIECAADRQLKTGDDVSDGKMEEGKEEELKHLCDVCGKSYQNKSSLRHHKKTHVKEGYQCAVCQQTFNRRNTMRLHTINQHGGKPPHSCTRCGKGFLHVARLEEHIRIQHTGEEPFSCPKCSKTFTSRRNLRRHCNEPTCAPKQKYPCDQCSKSCKSQYSLTYHKSLHHTKKPYQCELCGKGYATKENCKRHEDNHGEIPKWKKIPKPTSKDFVCDICNKSYSNKHFLARHKQTHSGVKPFKCNICAKAFLYKSALKEHLRTHSGEKPYICQHCGVAFRLSGHLRYHLKAVHDGDKQYSCEVCKKCFVFESTMLHHMKTHSKANKKQEPTKMRTKKNRPTLTKNSNNQIKQAISTCEDKALKKCTIKEIHDDSMQENLASDLRVAVAGDADDSAVLRSSATAGVTSTAMATSTAGTSSTAPTAALQTL